MRRVAGSVLVGLLLLVIVPASLFVSEMPGIVQALIQESSKVALVPNNYGAGHGGSLARSGFPSGFAPTFTDVSLLSIRDDVIDPIVAGGFDTLVLVQVDFIQNWLSNPTFKTRIDSFVFNGGKLIIWDSENVNNDYSNFIYPFTANTPGPQGAWNGDLWIVENNDMGTNNTGSTSYVNTATLHDAYDIGDANVIVTLNESWYTHMVAKNVYGVFGPVQTYARYGHGVIIYNGLDMDYMSDGQVIADDNDGVHNLGYIWYLQLKQQWDPDTWPGEIRTSGITVTPQTSTNAVGTTHTATATVRDSLANPIQGVSVTFRIFSGPNLGMIGTDTTDTTGQAHFSWTSTSAGTDKINATAPSPSQPGVTIFDDQAVKTWITDAHDQAVMNVQSYKTVVGQGYPTRVNVTVANQGGYAETSDVSLYADSGQAMSEVGLVGYWKLDEGSGATAYDSSGNDNHGILIDGPTWIDGKYGGALSFDGVDDGVNVSDSSSLDISEKITISAWIRTVPGTDIMEIVEKGDTTAPGQRGYALRISRNNEPVPPDAGPNEGGRANFMVSLTTQGVFPPHINSLTRVDDDKWHFIAGTYDGTAMRMYVDGALETTFNISGTMYTNPGYFLSIGQGRGGGRPFNGTLDEVRIYNRSLSADEIWDEYQRGLGPVGYWKFDEGTGTIAYDSSGNGNGGTLINGPLRVDGKYGKALRFDGTNDYVTIPNSASLNIVDAITIEAWIEPKTQSQEYPRIVSKWSDPSYQYLLRLNGSDNVQFFITDSTGNTRGPATSSTQISDPTKWYHIVGLFDGNNLRVYIDGAEEGSYAFSGSVNTGTEPLDIGAGIYYNRDFFFNGTIDEVRIYNRALSDEEVEALAGVDLVGHWKFDEGSGTIAYDSSVYGNNGTLVNGPAWVDGKIGEALSFDGADDYVDVSHSSSLNSFVDMTLAAWVKAPYGPVVGHGGETSSGYAGFMLAVSYNSPGDVAFWVGNYYGAWIRTDGGLVNDGKWHHVAATLKGNIGAIQVDGIERSLIGGNTFTNPSPNAGLGVKIGRRLAGYVNGDIDEVRIYDRALSSGEIREEYLRGASPVGYWRLDEGSGAVVYDSSGSGNNGTLINGPTWVSGRCNKALRFDGVDDYLLVGDSDSLDLTSSLTVEAWTRTENTHSQVILQKTSTGDSLFAYTFELDYITQPGQLVLALDPVDDDLGSYAWWEYTNIGIMDSNWHHVAGVFDSSGPDIRLYIDGIERTTTRSGIAANTIASTNGYLSIGKGRSSSPNYFNGTIDEVRIYDRALSASEIWTQYISTPIATQTVTLESGASTTLTFTWNTAGWTKGSYSISAYAWPVENETDTTDNTLSGAWVIVAMPGDLTGSTPNVPDGTVDIFDIVIVAVHFSHSPPHDHIPATIQYTACFNADINDDGIIDIFDIVVVAVHFGQIDP